jgi:predicted transcriptional regulator
MKDMAKVIEGIKFYTIPETAEALRVTPQTVRAYIQKQLQEVFDTKETPTL